MKIKIEDLKLKQQLLFKVDLKVNDKLTYAVKRNLQRMEKAMQPALEEVIESTQDFTIDKASVDDKGILLQVDDKHSFTPENKKAVIKFVADENKRFGNTQVEIEPYLISDVEAPGFERAKVIFDAFDVEELSGILYK